MMFKPTSPDKIVQHQLHEAQIARLEHQSHAEYHQAMAKMLDDRIARLTAETKQS